MLQQEDGLNKKYLCVDRRYVIVSFFLFVLPFFLALFSDIFELKALSLYSGAIYALSYLGFLSLIFELVRGEKRRLTGATNNHCIKLDRTYVAVTLLLFSLLFFSGILIKKSIVFVIFAGLLFYTGFLLLIFMMIKGEQQRRREVNTALTGDFKEIQGI